MGANDHGEGIHFQETIRRRLLSNDLFELMRNSNCYYLQLHQILQIPSRAEFFFANPKKEFLDLFDVLLKWHSCENVL